MAETTGQSNDLLIDCEIYIVLVGLCNKVFLVARCLYQMKRDKIHLLSNLQPLEVRRVFGSQRLWVIQELRFRMCFVFFQMALSWKWQVSYSKTWASWCLREEREWRSKSAGVDSFLKSHHVITQLPNNAIRLSWITVFAGSMSAPQSCPVPCHLPRPMINWILLSLSLRWMIRYVPFYLKCEFCSIKPQNITSSIVSHKHLSNK